MKKIYFTLFATFAMCGGMLMTSCSDESKDIISEVEQNQPKTITLTMSLPENESTRTNFEYIPGEEGGDGVLKVTWSLGSTMTFEEFSAEYANGSTWIRVYDNLYNTNKISQELYRQIENVLGSYPIIESSNWEQVKSLFRTPADKIGLYPDGAGNTPIPFEVTAVKDEGRTAVLSGTATPGNYVAVYPYMANKSIEEVKAVALSNQFQKESGNIEHLASSDVMQTASFRISEGNTNFAIPFTHQVAIMKIIVPAKTTISAVSIKGAWGETEYEAEFKNYTTTGNATAYIAAPAGTLGATEVTMYGPYASYRATKTFESKSINAGTMYKISVPESAFSEPITTTEEFINLGTAGEWKNMNEGANNPWEYGPSMCWNDASIISGCPSITQWQTFTNTSYVTLTKARMHGVNGAMITSKTNGNSVFLPQNDGKNWKYLLKDTNGEKGAVGGDYNVTALNYTVYVAKDLASYGLRLIQVQE